MKKLFPILIFIALLTACNQSPIETTPPTAEVTVPVTEIVFQKQTVPFYEAQNAPGSSYGLRKDMDATECAGILYTFESGISQEDRMHCIQSTSQLLSVLDCPTDLQIHIYKSSTYNSTFIQEGHIYTHPQDWDSSEYAATLLGGIFGEYCNYGLLRGYANYLWGTPIETTWQWDGETAPLDLNYLCFRAEFVEESQISTLKCIAVDFVASYIESNGEKAFQSLLNDSGDLEKNFVFQDVLEQYYSEHSIDHRPADFLFAPGGKSYDYLVKSNAGLVYIEKDWFDGNQDLCPYTYPGFLHQNYADIRQFFEINLRQMAQYRELFGLEPYRQGLRIFFTNHAGVKYSYYTDQNYSIALYNTGSLMHEYIHALTYGSAMLEYWANEGFARYFSSKYDYYGNAMENENCRNLPETVEYRHIHEYQKNIGRDVDMELDFENLQHIITSIYECDDPNDQGGYAPGASFIGYLVSRFGEEAVIEIICKTHDFGGDTYEALVADWQCFLADNYSGYTKIKG